ncbi:TPA: methyltransferase [Candidatus Poribacteria bacterium]|nr:methyltransferase [Candidatus Poribacteria bacterium]HCK16438.1 methyltransferase [Candidatus Poribacteria bacterium]
MIQKRKKPVTDFQEKVYAAVKRIPQGKVTTYKLLGKEVRCKSSQAVGQALKRNPFAPMVPCHRVIRSDLSIGGFAGQTHGAEITRKQILLKQEGILFDNEKLCDVDQIYYY